MNLYKEKMLKHSSLKGKRRAHHKYLYIDENGRYIYPDDVKNKFKNTVGARESDQINSAHQGSTGANYWDHFGDNRTVAKGAKSLNEQKQKTKDRKFLKNPRSLPVGAKESDQINSAHQGSTGANYWDHFGDNRKVATGAKSLNKQIAKTAARKTKARTEAGVEAGRDRVKKKKKKPTVKGSKKVTTWDNANVKRW